nr:TPA_asm: hypothetical protein HUJ06_002779 [Nelumbo nucifera]
MEGCQVFGLCSHGLPTNPGMSWINADFGSRGLAKQGFSCKPLHSAISNVKFIDSFSLDRKPLLLCGGSASKKKAVQVISPNVSSLSMTIDLLDAYDDEYNGVVIDPECLPTSANAFASILRTSLSIWKLKRKKGIWLKILEAQSDLVPIAIKEGFSCHHAEPGYVMLTYWIPDEPCMLPASPSHLIGVGGFVINDKREVLVVKEKQCPCRCSGVWKLPTGFVNKSEEIFYGAVREVKEETGIDTAFLEMTAFR